MGVGACTPTEDRRLTRAGETPSSSNERTVDDGEAGEEEEVEEEEEAEDGVAADESAAVEDGTFLLNVSVCCCDAYESVC